MPNNIIIDVDVNKGKVISGMEEIIKNKNLRSILLEINNKDANHAIKIKFLEKRVFDILKKKIILI